MVKKVKTINTRAESRSTGAKIFESEDLEDKDHTLKLVAKTNAAIGVEAAYVINNGGVGMIELENSAYTMDENSSLEATIKRVGGTKGEITAKIQPNPGSAIQDDFETEWFPTVTLNNGELEKTVTVAKTKRNTNLTGDRVFSIELTEKKNRRMQLSDLTVLQESQSKMQMELQKINFRHWLRIQRRWKNIFIQKDGTHLLKH